MNDEQGKNRSKYLTPPGPAHSVHRSSFIVDRSRHLPPNIFAVVMATGIVSLALNGAGFRLPSLLLFWLNVGLYAVLSVLLLARVLRHRADLVADLANH